MKRNTILLVGIIFLAAFLRFYQLGTIAPSLTWDEVSWGYNAYTLGIDGKDEFGVYLPYEYLESFGDFKPPVYAYLDIIPVMLFGLTEFAVRFPSALFGTLTVLLTYFLVKEIFFHFVIPTKRSAWRDLSHNSNAVAKDSSTSSRLNRDFAQNDNHYLPLLSTFLMAVSPWHIMLSRAAFEANIASFFLVLGVLLFLKAIHTKPILLPFAAVSFVITFYTFNSTRIVIPLLVLVLVVGFWKSLWEMKKQVILSALVGLLLLLPLVPFLLSPQAALRFKEVNIFSNEEIVIQANQEIENDNNSLFSKVIHNRRVAYAREYLIHYFDNLSPSFLFISGDENPKFSLQTVGQLFFWQLPFLVLLGGVFLFKKREGHWWIIPLWILISIVPAATARETPHALRTETALPMWQLLEAYGILALISLVPQKKKLLRKGVIAFISLVAIGNLTYFMHDYFTHYATIYSGPWQYGYKQAIQYAESVKDDYDVIYLTDSLGRPYIYTLFYSQTPPEKFRKEAKIERDAFGFVHVLGFDKYRFGDGESNLKQSLAAEGKVLYIDDPTRMPKNAVIKKEFMLLDGTEVLVGYTLE